MRTNATWTWMFQTFSRSWGHIELCTVNSMSHNTIEKLFWTSFSPSNCSLNINEFSCATLLAHKFVNNLETSFKFVFMQVIDLFFTIKAHKKNWGIILISRKCLFYARQSFFDEASFSRFINFQLFNVA